MAYYGLAAEGFGEHRGRLDAVIELDMPITGDGTLYIPYHRSGGRIRDTMSYSTNRGSGQTWSTGAFRRGQPAKRAGVTAVNDI